ncbi:ABC transporter substrate-binding protein [Photobacterium jeanii]|uniref:Endolytic murein transglycosylase n=1 Tax=Photobacterium jeanii TaxID=858640 RepID=A0A178KM53_9GAMM|nr:endolytic transglycosylase MltG [Photobacterium jeanii]OAN18347.1 ABC transporter substrate-binding protein [Photobacterium jeanii]PST91971.1 endolytic transglycosylase MltG [Photobacterium jeanii]
MLKKLFLAIVLLAVAAAGSIGWVYQQVVASLSQPVVHSQAQLFTVSPGTSFRGVLNQLDNEGIIEQTRWTRWVVKLEPSLAHVKVGTYQIQPDMDLQSVLALLTSGKEHQFAITLVEGDRFSDWVNQLTKAPHLSHSLEGMSEAEIAKAIGAKADKLEGYLLPETYHYTAGTADIELLRRAYQSMQHVLNDAWQKRDQTIPLKNPYEALIMASIIEKETAVDSERTLVSSVFMNRLNKGMRLQTDPTVIYGMGDKYKGNIRKKDLRTPTPYNTYTIFGLPPTPIAMPSKASVLAAVKPESSKYYYFVADGKGGHKFSKSLSEHNRAVRAYLRTLRK